MTSIIDKPLATEKALEQLDAFKPKLGHAYAADRNFDNGPGEHLSVSTLSPWVRHRLISRKTSAALGSLALPHPKNSFKKSSGVPIGGWLEMV